MTNRNELIIVLMLHDEVHPTNAMVTTYLSCDNIYIAFEVDAGSSVLVTDLQFYRRYFQSHTLLLLAVYDVQVITIYRF